MQASHEGIRKELVHQQLSLSLPPSLAPTHSATTHSFLHDSAVHECRSGSRSAVAAKLKGSAFDALVALIELITGARGKESRMRRRRSVCERSQEEMQGMLLSFSSPSATGTRCLS